MSATLALTALLMGLAGGPHCVAMCGAACAGIGQAAGPAKTGAMWAFQVGRVLGYSALGAAGAASMQGIGWLTTQSAAVRPLWTLMHVAALALGLLLAFNARQPAWLEATGKNIWRLTRLWTAKRTIGAPLMVGAVWAFLPCGLLYSALLVATLSGSALQGAGVMALFALGTSVSMMAGPWLWLKLAGRGSGQWGVRVAGLALAASSAWVMWAGFAHDAAPWCAPAASAAAQR
jgi:uncharacterized protein